MAEFPNGPLPIRVRALIHGQWVDFGPVTAIVDDYWTDVWLDVWLGRTTIDARRLPNQEIAITRGRTDETSDQQPGECTILLWNEDGYLTPGDPRSPFFADGQGGWGLGCEVQVLVGDSVRLHGEVSEVVEGWEFGDLSDTLTDEELLDLGAIAESEPWRLGFSTVRVTVSGILRRLSQRTKPLRSALQRRITSPSNLPHVADYFPCEDGKDSGFFATGLPSSAGGTPMAVQSGWTLASNPDLWGSDPLPVCQSGQDADLLANVSARTSLLDDRWAVELLMTIPEAPEVPESSVQVEVLTTGTYRRMVALISSDGVEPTVEFRLFDDTGAVVLTGSGGDHPGLLFGRGWRNLRIYVDDDGPSFNWAPITPRVDPSGGIGWSAVPGQVVGVPTRVTVRVAQAPSGGVGVGHLVIHDNPGGWLIPADVGYQEERASVRAQRIAGEESIPITPRYGPPGCGLVSSATTRKMGTQESQPALALLREAAATENGLLLEKRDDLSLVFFGRGARYNREVAFTLDARGRSQIANPFAPTTDDQTRANDVTAQRIDGSEYRKVDEDATERYDQSLSFSMASDFAVKHYAGWGFHLGTWDGARYPQVTIDFAICGDTLTSGDRKLLDVWLGLDDPLQTRFQVVNLPPQHPSYPVVDQIIEGYTETLSPHGWVVELNCSPAGLWQVAVWGETRYQPRSCTLADAIDDDDTSLSVASSTVWADDIEPFDVLIGPAVSPERVTVTNVSGSSSPQTFTVTRGVAGYQRAHPAGARVVAADAQVLGL